MINWNVLILKMGPTTGQNLKTERLITSSMNRGVGKNGIMAISKTTRLKRKCFKNMFLFSVNFRQKLRKAVGIKTAQEFRTRE